MTRSSLHRTALLALAALMLTAAPASAHHVMGGEMPSTFVQGFLSGLGHPVIGLDHLAFLIAVGVAVGVGGLNLGLPVLFVAASAVGVGIHVVGFQLPGAELIVASSVVIVGALIAAGRALPLAAWGALFGAAGLAHGYAYGESIFGAEPTPLLAYLLGLVVIQSALSVGVALLFRIRNLSVSAVAPRLAGAVVVGIGIAALLGQIIPDA
ncbi:HupE/UreJ family protein [Methyloceanibacter caenitepidi]|nr:HupE/UreJ family protein [Methyloceanibacter caenitepidi]